LVRPIRAIPRRWAPAALPSWSTYRSMWTKRDKPLWP